MQVEQLERQVTPLAAALVAAGADAGDLIADARDRFDAALVAESSDVLAELQRELGGVA